MSTACGLKKKQAELEKRERSCMKKKCDSNPGRLLQVIVPFRGSEPRYINKVQKLSSPKESGDFLFLPLIKIIKYILTGRRSMATFVRLSGIFLPAEGKRSTFAWRRKLCARSLGIINGTFTSEFYFCFNDFDRLKMQRSVILLFSAKNFFLVKTKFRVYAIRLLIFIGKWFCFRYLVAWKCVSFWFKIKNSLIIFVFLNSTFIFILFH